MSSTMRKCENQERVCAIPGGSLSPKGDLEHRYPQKIPPNPNGTDLTEILQIKLNIDYKRV